MSTCTIIRDKIHEEFQAFLAFIPGISYTLSKHDNEVEIRGDIIFYLYITDDTKIVDITQLVANDTIRGKGYVLKLISIAFHIATEYGYYLTVSQLVPGFYNALVNRRRARVIEPGDTVQITHETILTK